MRRMMVTALALLALSTAASAQPFGPIAAPGVQYSGPAPSTNDCAKFVDRDHVTSAGGSCGGSGSPGGSDTQLQRNNAGNFGGISGATTDGTSVTFGSGNLKLNGATSGTSLLNAPATGGGTVTLPPGSDTAAGIAATQTLTNKTISGASNTLSNIGNSSLTNSSTTIGGQSTALGGSTTNQGNGGKIQLSTGSTTTNNCVKFDANGNTVDAGAACGGGGGSLTTTDGTNSVANTTTQTFGNGFVVGGSAGSATINQTVPFYAKSADYTVNASENDMGACLSLSGSHTLTIGAISSSLFANGMTSCIQNGSGTWTITSTPGVKLPDGTTSNSVSVPAGAGFDLVSDGTNLTLVTGQYIVPNARLATMAQHTFKGNNTGSTATPLDLTATQLTAELNAVVGDSGSGGTKGLVPAPASGDAAAGKFLKADGTFAVPAGGGIGCVPSGSAGQVLVDSGVGACTSRPYTAPATVAADNTLVATSSSVLAAKAIGDCDDTGGNHLNYDTTTHAFSCGTSGGGSSAPSTPRGRLTLATGAPIITADQTAKGTIYYDCYQGNGVPYYNGSSDAGDTIASCEVSLVLDSTNHASGSNYDVFWFHNSGTPVLCAGAAWTNSTTRSDAIHNTRGYWTNTSSLTHCYNNSVDYGSISTDQATYIGSFHATANGQTGMQIALASGAGGGNPCMCLYNGYNRVAFTGLNRDSNTSWTYGTATWRSSDNSASNRVSFMDGLGTSRPGVVFSQFNQSGSAKSGRIGTVENSTSATPTEQCAPNGSGITHITCSDGFLPALGFNYIQAMEWNTDATVSTFSQAANNSAGASAYLLRVDVEL